MALYVITGPPGGGKTTYVREHAKPGDIRVDLDRLANHLAGLSEDGHEHAGPVLAVARAARTAAIDTALKHSDAVDVWIIDSKPTPKNIERYQQHNAEIIVCDPGKDVVMKRVKRERPAHTLKAAAAWYDKHGKKLTIKSFAYDKRRPRGLVLDTRHLPNSHDVPALRVPNGTSRRVADWLQSHDEVAHFITNAIDRIEREQPAEVWVGCSAGKHRSVYVAEQLAEHYGTTAEHTALRPARLAGTTERGYGWEHQQARDRLLRRHRDGTPCWWCGLPMHKSKHENWDGRPLAADHIEEGGAKAGTTAGRLLHGKCNSQRQDGSNDHLRPAVTDRHPSEPLGGSKPEPTTERFDFGGVSFA